MLGTGTPWWSSGWAPVLPIKGAPGSVLVEELDPRITTTKT